jgi:dTDP-4-amino-4,6-dideoxygalactose transaminase
MNRTEQILAGYFERKYCLLTGCATAAMYLILKSIKLEYPSDRFKVLYPAINCMMPVNAAIYADWEPVFCDINLRDYTMDVNAAQSMMENGDIGVLVPTHLYGHTCAMDELITAAQKHGVFILEDAAQAVGGTYRGKKLGSFGNASVVSFGHSKILDCGGGGAILTDDSALYEAVLAGNQLLPEKPNHLAALTNAFREAYHSIYGLIGVAGKYWELMFNLQILSQEMYLYQIDSLTANRIGGQIDSIGDVAAARMKRRNLYEDNLNRTRLDLPVIQNGSTSWRYTFMYPGNRDGFIQKLATGNVDAACWFPALYPMYSKQNSGLFPNANLFQRQVVNLRTAPKYSEEKIGKDIQTINMFLTQEIEFAQSGGRSQ